MKHKEFREYISSYLEDDLLEDHKNAFEAHLEGCTICRAEYENVKKLLFELSTLEEEELPVGFENELHVKLQKEFRQSVNYKCTSDINSTLNGKQSKLFNPVVRKYIRIGTGIAATAVICILTTGLYLNSNVFGTLSKSQNSSLSTASNSLSDTMGSAPKASMDRTSKADSTSESAKKNEASKEQPTGSIMADSIIAPIIGWLAEDKAVQKNGQTKDTSAETEKQAGISNQTDTNKQVGSSNQEVTIRGNISNSQETIAKQNESIKQETTTKQNESIKQEDTSKQNESIKQEDTSKQNEGKTQPNTINPAETNTGSLTHTQEIYGAKIDKKDSEDKSVIAATTGNKENPSAKVVIEDKYFIFRTADVASAKSIINNKMIEIGGIFKETQEAQMALTPKKIIVIEINGDKQEEILDFLQVQFGNADLGIMSFYVMANTYSDGLSGSSKPIETIEVIVKCN